MKQVCLFCDRTAQDSNLWCQEAYCPAELSPNVLEYGEYLGEIEIIKPVIVLRSAVLYEAMHQKEKVFLKVAHPGEAHKEKLKREASFLTRLQLARKSHPGLPALLPAYSNTGLKEFPYGKASLRGVMLYYYLFEHVPNAEPLRDILLKNPQPWFKHVGWTMLTLSSIVAFLHQHGLFHLCLSPDLVLIRFDADNVPRLLLFDLGVAAERQSAAGIWDPMFILPAYTPPEFVAQPQIRPHPTADVYGLGMMLYEMLVGQPPIAYKLLSDADVYKNIERSRLARMDRLDLAGVPDIAVQAVSDRPERRQPDIPHLYQQLQGVFEGVPKERTSRWPSLQTLGVLVGAFLAIAFLIALAVSLAVL